MPSLNSLDFRPPSIHNRDMKLNFWQWLGIVLLLVGLILMAYKRSNTVPAPTVPVPAGPTTAPANPA
jgi:hypothetical protein